MLLLFDIDATLVTTARAGVHAMRDAGIDLVGPHFTADGYSFAGSLDPVIIADMLRAHPTDPSRPEPDGARIRRFREVYAEHLSRRLSANNTSRALPGVHALLDALWRRACESAGERPVTMGLLTGNFEETGTLKLRCAGIDMSRFAVRVWGDDSPHHPPRREHLPPVAMRRYRETFGREIDPRVDPRVGGVTIIGDTPHDVSCGLAHGCRVLAVATGQFSRADLLAAGAHHAVDTQEDTAGIAGWLLEGERRGG